MHIALEDPEGFIFLVMHMQRCADAGRVRDFHHRQRSTCIRCRCLDYRQAAEPPARLSVVTSNCKGVGHRSFLSAVRHRPRSISWSQIESQSAGRRARGANPNRGPNPRARSRSEKSSGTGGGGGDHSSNVGLGGGERLPNGRSSPGAQSAARGDRTAGLSTTIRAGSPGATCSALQARFVSRGNRMGK